MDTERFTVGDLRAAIDCGQIVPYFQPIVSLHNSELWGFEMLARWLHPDKGLISPARFIPLAENSGLIPLLFESLTLQTLPIAATLSRKLNWSVNLAKYTQPLLDHAITTFTATPDGMLDWLGMNGLGIPNELALGDNWHNLVHPDERERAAATWAEAVRTQLPYFDEFRVQSPNDGWHRFQSRAVPRFNECGQMIGWSGLLQDLGRVRDKLARPVLEKLTPQNTDQRQPVAAPHQVGPVH